MAKERGGIIGDGVTRDHEEEHWGINLGLLVEHDVFKGWERLEAGQRQVEGDGRAIAWEVSAHCGGLDVGAVGHGICRLWAGKED